MGYGRNALWLAAQGYAVEGWEMDRRYLAEARREARRRGLKLRLRRGDFTRLRQGFPRLGSGQVGGQARTRFRGPYDVIVISGVLHQVRRSLALQVLRRARATLAPGGRLFLLVKLTRDGYFRQVRKDPNWIPVPGERNTRRRVRAPDPPKYWRGRKRARRWILSALTPGEVRNALRGLRLRHYREVVLRSDWEEPEPVTHHMAEVVAQKPKSE